jgi:hypothetical protein
MTREKKQFLHALDRELQIECVLDENAFLLAVAPTNGENHFLKLEFTRGFAVELRDFLVEHLGSDAA